MKVTTIQDLLYTVADRVAEWQQRRRPPRKLAPVFPSITASQPESRDFAAEIRALGPGKTAAQVEAILGGVGFITLTCDQCGRDAQAIVELGHFANDVYDDTTIEICLDCAKNAVAVLEARNAN